MGATIELEHGNIKARTKKLQPTQYTMPKISVGATANLMMCAVLTKGETILENCAMEPDIIDLGNFLIKMGAKIIGLGTERIVITGVKKLKPTTHSIMPDRIEAGTFLLAGAATRGSVKVTHIVPEHIEAFLESLKEMGFIIKIGKNWASVKSSRSLQGVIVKTMPHPGFPTDLQAPIMSLMTTLPGISVIIETIFENRFTHVAELRRMGANITTEGTVAIINGIKQLSSAPVMMSDLRAGAALIIAALAGKGKSEIRRIYHADRGYEKLCHKLSALGADIKREQGGGL
jgi:UDP-N-acetylglucosamine 1-carboxyvinyltransferase